ncbi:MAG TPA: glycosyltransferase family 4 protein [Chitinophagaceae bacterium]|nr:glycosyltransferase family 4 protein [Chitinophagaceae bacterium]
MARPVQMTICIASSNYYPPFGGIATFTHRLSALLANNGHTSIVLTVSHDLSSEEDKIETLGNGVILVMLKTSFLKYYTYYKQYFRRGGLDAPYWIAMGMSMRDWLITNSSLYNIDMVDASAYGGLAAFLEHPLLPPVVLSGHGAFFQYKQYNQDRIDDHALVVEELERIAFKKCEGIISHSPQSREDILNYTDRPVVMARIPFLFEEKNSDRLRHEVENTPYALVVGALQKMKGPEILCESLSLLNNSTVKVIWAGSDNYNHETKQLMSDYLASKYPGVWNKKLIWKRSVPREELSALYAGACYIVIPTIWESFNVIPIEAAFYGKPVILTNTTGSSFLFSNGEDALVIPAENSRELASALEKLWRSPQLCTAMGKAAQLKISSLLNEQDIIGERIKIYRDLLNNVKKLSAEKDLLFLEKYITPPRKAYYKVREWVRKLTRSRKKN